MITFFLVFKNVQRITKEGKTSNVLWWWQWIN